MPVLSSFSLPAFIQDFPAGSPSDKLMKWRWNINVSGWILQAMPPAPSFFYDPISTNIPQGTASVIVQWNAFPGRLQQYYGNPPPNPPTNPNPLTQDQIYSLADTGFYTDSAGNPQSFPPIPVVICPVADWSMGTKTFGPYGPRGWLDEYCEWSAARDSNGNLVRIDFACENPEYWNTLWKVSPPTVASIYQSVLNFDAPANRQVSVQVQDLELVVNGQVVLDPETGQPAYNPLNKWNNSPISVRSGNAAAFTGGVMHLTSTPNTLQTELGLAGAATVQYQPPGGTGNSDPQALICCGQYGQEYRHSDPHIGQSVNMVVGGQLTGSPLLACLADPVGLYIQPLTSPAAFSFARNIDPSQLPKGAAASDIWQVVRGSPTVIDPVTGQPFPGGMILHAICQIPSAWLAVYPAMTLADILINGTPITYAGQVADQFNIGLYARPLATTATPPPAPCASSVATPGQPLQSMMFSNLWQAYYNSVEVAPTGQQMSLASNTTFIAVQLPADGSTHDLTMTCNTPTGTPGIDVLLADGSGPDPAVSVKITGSSAANYAVPGNSFPGQYTALSLSVSVAAGAKSGLRAVTITDPQAGPSTLQASLYVL